MQKFKMKRMNNQKSPYAGPGHLNAKYSSSLNENAAAALCLNRTLISRLNGKAFCLNRQKYGGSRPRKIFKYRVCGAGTKN